MRKINDCCHFKPLSFGVNYYPTVESGYNDHFVILISGYLRTKPHHCWLNSVQLEGEISFLAHICISEEKLRFGVRTLRRNVHQTFTHFPSCCGRRVLPSCSLNRDQLAMDQWKTCGSDSVPVLSLCFKPHG